MTPAQRRDAINSNPTLEGWKVPLVERVNAHDSIEVICPHGHIRLTLAKHLTGTVTCDECQAEHAADLANALVVTLGLQWEDIFGNSYVYVPKLGMWADEIKRKFDAGKPLLPVFNNSRTMELFLAERGATLVGKCTSPEEKVRIICENGHTFDVRPSNLNPRGQRKGSWCPQCKKDH